MYPGRTTFSLPSRSPPESPDTPDRQNGHRSVTWSIPGHFSEDTILPSMRQRIGLEDLEQCSHETKETKDMDPSTPEFLAWRRLYLSKAKLTGITEVSAVMAGFSVAATVELTFSSHPNSFFLSAFTAVTAMLVGTTMMAIMISTCILPHILVVANMSPNSDVNDSPHDRMINYINLSWVLANSLSIFLFSTDVIIVSWIKFADFTPVAPWCTTIIMVPVLLAVVAFGIVFYRQLIKHQYLISDRKYQELEDLKRQLDTNIQFNTYNV